MPLRKRKERKKTMSINKKFVALAVTAGVVGAGTLGSLAMAESSGDTYPPVVDKIATKFNLNKDEVKKVFEEERASHEAEHKQRLEAKLTQAVKDGKLTEDQKSKLIAKLEEMHKNRVEDRQEAKAEREAKRDEFKKWAESNGINLEDVMPAPNKGHGPRGGGPF